MQRRHLLSILLILLSAGIRAEAAQPSNTVICITNYGDELMSQQKLKDAVLILEQVFKRQPDYEIARKNLAIAYNNLAIACKNQDEALENVHRALALEPTDENAYKDLVYILSKFQIDILDVTAREKFAAALKSKGDVVAAYVEYQIALKDDPSAQSKIDELVTDDMRKQASSVGGVGAALLLSKIDIDHSKDQAFNFDYLRYDRDVEHKIRTVWKAPPSLSDRKVKVAFTVKSDGTISPPKVVSSSGDKAIDAYALKSVQGACPFKPLARDIFFDVPLTITLDARGDQSPTYYLNGEAKPDGLRFSTGAELHPLRAPKGVDEKLQAKTDAALSQANKVEDEISKLQQQFGANSVKLCPKFRAAANLYVQANDYKLAEDCLKSAISIAQAANSVNEQAAALSQLGSLYYTMSRNDEAATNFKQSLDLMESEPSKDPTALRQTMESYAKVLYKLNRVAEANQLYEKMRALPKAQ